MWASRAHGMTYDRTERQQIRRTTDQMDNRSERQQIRKTTGQKDNRIMWARRPHGMAHGMTIDTIYVVTDR